MDNRPEYPGNNQTNYPEGYQNQNHPINQHDQMNQQYAQMNQYPQQFQPNHPQMEPPMTLKEWIITYLIMIVPLANIIMLFVWAFSDGEKISKRNWAKANLILAGIGIALYIILMIIIFAIFGATMNGTSYGY